MGLNDTPSSERIQIGFFGRRNAGKSSIVNAVTGQQLAVVSETKGTTTDPVIKTMELLPLGPVVIIDTPGFDDEGSLGALRVKKTKQILNRVDLAVLVIDQTEGMQICDRELIQIFEEKNIPFLILMNKADLSAETPEISVELREKTISASAVTGEGIQQVKERLGVLLPEKADKLLLVGDLVQPGDLVILVIPIDKAAPKGRLILPQQQVIRDLLEADATAICVKEHELRETLQKLGEKPALVITDSQVFAKVSADVPEDIPLTSFSILMARYKGFLEQAVLGVTAVEHLKDHQKILIAEGCTHHKQCDDIGSVKIPRWLRNYTGKQIKIETCSGRDFPEDLSEYALIIHCGGCMLNEREISYRMKCAMDQQIPVTNYGITIAYMQGILKRSIRLFPSLYDAADEAGMN